jgi:phosphatidylinositol alpha 1,6-mannosyltransferase
MLHLASPFLIGARAAALAWQFRVPSVAVYQTEVAAYLRHYRGLGRGEATVWKWLRTIHNSVDRTLAPANTAAADLNAHGIRNVWLWGRVVDATRFHPSKRNSAVRRALAPNGESWSDTWAAWPPRSGSIYSARLPACAVYAWS